MPRGPARGSGGRRAQPAEVVQLRGRPATLSRRRADGTAQPVDSRVLPRLEAAEPPRQLPPAARAYWDSISAWLMEAGVLRATDCFALVNLCVTLVLMEQAESTLIADGQLVSREMRDSENMLQHPGFSNYLALSKLTDARLSQFGLTPDSRARIFSTVQSGRKDSALASMLAGPPPEDDYLPPAPDTAPRKRKAARKRRR